MNLTRYRPTLPAMIASTLLVVGLIAVLATTMGAKDKQQLRDEQEIKDVVVKAFELTHGGSTMLPEPYLSEPTTEVPSDVSGMLHESVIASLSEVYSDQSPILQNRIELMQREIDRQGPNGYRDLGGGMRWIRNVSIQVNGDTAVFEADIRGWGQFIMDGKTFTPENTAHERYTLVREEGAWKITDHEITFLPGEEP